MPPHETQSGHSRDRGSLPALYTVLGALLLLAPLTASPQEGDLEAAAVYWSQHPYLDAAPEILDAAARAARRSDRDAYVDALRGAADPPADIPTVLEQQSELDALTEIALDEQTADAAESTPLPSGVLAGVAAGAIAVLGWTLGLWRRRARQARPASPGRRRETRADPAPRREVEREPPQVEAEPAPAAPGPVDALALDSEEPMELESTQHRVDVGPGPDSRSDAPLPADLMPDDEPLDLDGEPVGVVREDSEGAGSDQIVDELATEILEMDLDLGALPAQFCALKIDHIEPTGLDAAGLLLGPGRGHLHWERVQAVAVASVEGLAERPVAVVDLILNWHDAVDGTLVLCRMRSDRVHLRELVPGAPSVAEALRSLLATTLDASGALPLPDADAARGRPFRSFPDLDTYQREVLNLV